jgi:hypothetical protein
MARHGASVGPGRCGPGSDPGRPNGLHYFKFWAVQYEIVAILDRTDLDVRHVKTRIGFVELLWPVEDIAVRDLRQKFLFLPLLPVHHQHGHDHSTT